MCTYFVRQNYSHSISFICVTINFILFICCVKKVQYTTIFEFFFFISQQIFFFFVTENVGVQHSLKVSSSITDSFWICYWISNKDSDFGFNFFINCSKFNPWYTNTQIKFVVIQVVFKFETLILITITAWAL